MKIILFWLLLVSLTCVIYMPGLHGPFILDDVENFKPIPEWLAGNLQLAELIFGNRSGTLGRSLAMLTFALSAQLGGFTPFAFKLTNLVLHICGGGLLFLVLRHLARRDPIVSSRATMVAFVVVAIWLVHPLLSSTVLYAVQRMTILAACFMLLGLLFWLIGRKSLEASPGSRSGPLLMFVAMPCCAVLASISKEIGVLTPFLCVATEWCYFRPAAGFKRPVAAKAAVIVFGWLPLAAGITLLAWKWPSLVTAGYDNREFTLLERTLSQPRFLWDYVFQIVIPRSARMGVFHDDVLLSTGLTQPITTLLSIAGWCLVIFFSWFSRKALPAVAWGFSVFFIAHSLESSFLPLLPYFEHRNYLASIGILWALAITMCSLGQKALRPNDGSVRLSAAVAVVLVCSLALGTFSRSTAWASKSALFSSALDHHPESRWLRMEIAHELMQAKPPNASAAASHYAAMTTNPNPATRQIGRLGLVALECFSAQKTASGSGAALFEVQKAVQADLLNAIEGLASIVAARPCQNLSPDELARHIATWLDSQAQPASNESIWRLRFRAFQLFSQSNKVANAIAQAELAWLPGISDPAIGTAYADALANAGRTKDALEILYEVQEHIPAHDLTGRRIVEEQFRRLSAPP